MTLPAGTRLGPYEIVSLVGAGGMGEVYRARDTRLDRDVAIKVLGAAFARDEDRLRRFTIEAQATGALNHPNILAIYDLGTHEGAPYLVSELLDGETLRSRMDAGRIPRSKAIDIARQVASGLAVAHARGITHRDIKPDNLFVTRDGRAKILDFGLAKQRAEQDPDLTRMGSGTVAGTVLGTVGYMSPEQVRGDAADARSDLFSLGVVLYELLSGRRPFVGDSAVQTMNAVLTDDPPTIETSAGALPPAFERVVRHCLEKNPDERFQSARDLAFALDALSTSSMASSSAVAAVEAVRPRRRLLPIVTAALAVVSALLAAALLLRPAGVNLEAYKFTPFAMDAEREGGAAWSPDGRTIAYGKDVNGISQIFIRDLDADAPVQLTRGTTNAGAPFWWPDSSRIGFQSGDIWAVSRVGGSPELIQKGPVSAAALSADGSTLAMWRVSNDGNKTTGTVWLASPANAEQREYAPAPFKVDANLVPVSLKFAPDGRTLLLLHFDNDVRTAVWRLPMPAGGGQPTRIFTAAPLWKIPPQISWMPDNRHVVAAFPPPDSSTSQLWLADLSGETATPLSVGLTPMSQPSVSPDGTRVTFTAGGANFDLVEVPLDGTPLRELFATSGDESSGAWIRGSRRIVYIANRNGELELRARSLTEGTDRRITTGAALAGPVASPDGQRVAYTQEGRVWVAPLTGGAPTEVSRGVGLEFGVDWSPDGERLVSHRTADTRTLRVTRVGSSEAPVDLTLPGVGGGLPAWSPDGAWIAVTRARPEAGITLTSPDGARQRHLAPGRVFAGLMWSTDSRTIYALASTPNNEPQIIAIDVTSDVARVVATLGRDVAFGVPNSPGLRLTLGPDGTSFLTTIVRINTDLWILENFRPPSGLRRWF